MVHFPPGGKFHVAARVAATIYTESGSDTGGGLGGARQ